MKMKKAIIILFLFATSFNRLAQSTLIKELIFIKTKNSRRQKQYSKSFRKMNQEMEK